MHSLRTWHLLGLPLLWAVPLSAQAAPATASLEFLGYSAGAALSELDSLYHARSGKGFTCRTAQRDRSVRECRGAFQDDDGTQVDVWLSVMDGRTGIIMLHAGGSSDRVMAWRRHLEERYGLVEAHVQGTQWSMQWVRRGRMIRLTWRVDRSAREVSVSLVDGTVLDNWGNKTRNPR